MYDQVLAVSVIQSSNQCLCCSTGLSLSWPKTKLQNVGAGDPPSEILIHGVPFEEVEELEELIYLGSKQSFIL